MSDMFTFSDADRYNNILQMLIRCCVKVTKRLLPMFVSSLGYTCVDQFLSKEKAHILKMPSASEKKNRDILYPPFRTQTQIEEWDMSLLSCVFTQVQRKLLCYEIADPIDPVLMHYKLKVLASTVGQQYEDKLYPRSGKSTEVNTWNMSLCSCLFSVLCPKPHTLHVRLAESLNVLREMRNTLCHSKRLEMEHVVYEEHISVLKEFISSGLTYIGDVAFETEIKEGMDDIEHGKMRSYVAIDHKHLQESYESDREISHRLDGLEKAMQQLTLQLQNDQEGRHITGAKRECLKIQLNFDNAVWMWKFIKFYISGTIDSLLEPIQTLLRTKKEFEKLEMTVVLPDVFAVLNQSGKPKEIDSSITMCVLELLNQKLIPSEDKEQDDSVRKSLPLKLTNIQHDVENQLKSVVQHVVKCKDCDEMLCSDCARVHRNLKMSRDPIMIDMILLRGDRLILADQCIENVKIVDLGTNNLMSKINVPGRLTGICLLPGDRVAVCSENRGIHFLKARGQLSLEESIKVGYGCQSVCYHNERLIVAFDSGKVVIMDMTGKVTKDSNDSGKPIFSTYLSLAVVSEGQEAVIFVSEYQKDTIIKLDMDLNILQTFQDPALIGPRGMTVVGSQLLICGYDSNNIMCLHLPNSQMIQLLGENDDIQYPLHVCFSQQQNMLYVASDDKSVREYRPCALLNHHVQKGEIQTKFTSSWLIEALRLLC
ncbi:uncharacterized protein LOC128238548 isoform X2 [Mya arenaria]|uniref:uncharacterized protein LOC128238548 isoform X2 n=1 Tax=Mya arenaria TaxID=6604 RepID=UPI0022E23EA6|nr:uncharacterized protein LOC128238548 isoform X2 [Mya arenaria]